jgi:hypothetical protein
MMVYDLNFIGITILPNETNSPLIIYANTVLALPVSS